MSKIIEEFDYEKQNLFERICGFITEEEVQKQF